MNNNAIELVQNKKSFLGPKTQQQMETYPRSEQAKSFPQGRKIQNGDTGNHLDILPTRGVGYLNRLQGRLLPHTDTGTIQEIYEISYLGSDIPVQGSAFRFVYSTHGVHCSSKGGETDGHTQGYKDPPVLRRPVGESHIPPGLSPAYSGSSRNVSKVRLAGESGKVRTRAQANLRFCRVPVRPQIRPGPTDIGQVAEPSRENTKTTIPTSLSSLTIHVLDRFTNSHRKASSPRPTSFETHSVASEEQLKGTGITRKGDPNSEVFASVARGRQCTHRLTITPNKTCSASLYRCIKEGWGAQLNEHTAQGTWSLLERKLHINYLELKAAFLALKEIQDLCADKIVLLSTDNTTVASYISKEGGMRSGPLCALLWRILTSQNK